MPHNLSIFSFQFSPSPAARHYHPTLSIWLSVDPMSDKYPGVIDEMESSSDLFNIVSSENDDCLSGRYRPFANTTGGQIELYSNDLNLETLSHEIFHGYQDMYGQGENSIVNGDGHTAIIHFNVLTKRTA